MQLPKAVVYDIMAAYAEDIKSSTSPATQMRKMRERGEKGERGERMERGDRDGKWEREKERR
tara:strand:- start:226 stop:411 length:186 start_codon:yes stop_codon:yes gene_type:complete